MPGLLLNTPGDLLAIATTFFRNFFFRIRPDTFTLSLHFSIH